MVLFKSRKPESPVVEDHAAPLNQAEQKKGRPTPKRKQAEQAHARPLVGARSRVNTMTKEEKREAIRRDRERYAQAMATADERLLPIRDKGPIKRFTRDWVDSHWWLSEYFLFLTIGMLVALLLLQSLSAYVATFGVLFMWLVMFAVAIDTFIRSRIMKKALVARFGEIPRGTVSYGVMRALSFRRSRQPKPQVKRGEYPS